MKCPNCGKEAISFRNFYFTKTQDFKCRNCVTKIINQRSIKSIIAFFSGGIGAFVGIWIRDLIFGVNNRGWTITLWFGLILLCTLTTFNLITAYLIWKHKPLKHEPQQKPEFP